VFQGIWNYFWDHFSDISYRGTLVLVKYGSVRRTPEEEREEFRWIERR
jgi:hypothetical protein